MPHNPQVRAHSPVSRSLPAAGVGHVVEARRGLRSFGVAPGPVKEFTSAQRDDQISRAEDGIRTRDPHLGNVFEIVHGVRTSPLSWAPVYGLSTKCTRIRPCCRAVYYEVGTRFWQRRVLGAPPPGELGQVLAA
jgi:hypothetical protein